MKPEHKEMLDELGALRKRKDDLSNFIMDCADDNPFDKLPYVEQYLLYDQLENMQKYYNVLAARCSYFGILPEGWDSD